MVLLLLLLIDLNLIYNGSRIILSQLMLSAAYCDHLSKDTSTYSYKIRIIGFCFQTVNVIKSAWSRTDHIKQLLQKSELVFQQNVIRNR